MQCLLFKNTATCMFVWKAVFRSSVEQKNLWKKFWKLRWERENSVKYSFWNSLITVLKTWKFPMKLGECVRLPTRVPQVPRFPLIKHREQDTSVGSKVKNTLPTFSRTDRFHLAAKMTYHSKSLQASQAAQEFCSCRFFYVATAHDPTRL